VDDEKGFFYCFGCGAHGDAIDFVRRRHDCSFKKALGKLGLGSYRPSKAELAERERQMEAYRREQQVEQERRWEAAAAEALRIWNDSVPIYGQGHPYLKSKAVESFGLRARGNYLIIPPI
jgi:DNA primase